MIKLKGDKDIEKLDLIIKNQEIKGEPGEKINVEREICMKIYDVNKKAVN